MRRTFRVIPAVMLLASFSAFADGRFWQVRHPMSGIVVMQFSFPDAERCASLIRNMSFRTEATAKQTASVSSCRSESASRNMRARATLRDKTGNYLFDVETSVPSICKSLVNDVVRDSKGAVEVVAGCMELGTTP
jgi:hypothetical protein